MDSLRETRLLQTDFKYPLVRVERTLQRDPATGQDTVRREEIMVGSHLLVKPRSGVGDAVFAEAMKRVGGARVRPLPGSDYRIVEFAAPDAAAVPRMLKALQALPGIIAHAEPDYIVRAMTVPNDTRFSEQWNLNNAGQTGGTPHADINATEAWTTTTGSNSVIVAVVDSGIDYAHPDLAANIWTNTGEVAGNGLDDDHDGYIDDTRGWNFVSSNNTPQDDRSHGTHVAGTIGAAGNNGNGVTGVCWQVRLMPLKFLDSTGNGATSDAIAAINYARVKGANIINNSWGGSSFSQSLKDAIDAAGNAGILNVCAAGNTDDFGTVYDRDVTPGYPASYGSDGIMGVASTDRNDNLSGFSSYGATTVHLAAPGSEILSTIPGDSYGTRNGTSMAAPHVSGIAALLKAYKPALAAPDLKLILQASVDHLPSLEGKVITEGRANAATTLRNANDIATLPAKGLIAVGNQGGPFTPTSMTYTLKNFHGASINWTAALTGAAWASVSPPSGTLPAGASATVTVTVNTALANTAPPGLQQGTLTIHNTTTGTDTTRAVNLDVRIPYIYSFDLNTDPGWERQGMWQYGTPTGKGGGNGNGGPDPIAAATGTKVFGVNLNGDYMTQQTGPHYLTAGPFDLRGYTSLKLEFQRWLNAPSPYDTLHNVQVSKDGGATWDWLFPVQYNSNTFADNAWILQSFALGPAMDNQSSVLIRWGYEPNASSTAAAGWNIDDIQIKGLPGKRVFLDGLASVAENSGTAVLTLRVEPPSATSLTVTLASSDTTAATLPASVVIPANTSSFAVTATLIDDAVLDGTQPAILTPSVAGYTSVPRSLDVTDNETATIALSLPSSATEGQAPATGVVSLSVVPGRDASIALSSSDPGAATVPASVTIAAGTTSVTFPINLPDNPMAEGDKTPQISASVAGWTGASVALTLLDDDASALYLTFTPTASPYTFAEGIAPGAATVSLAAPRYTDTVITLSPSSSARLQMPASVTIPSGYVSAAIAPITVTDDAIANGVQTVEVLASSPGMTGAVQAVTVADNEAASVAIDFITSPKTVGAADVVTVRALDANGALAAGFSGSGTLAAENAGAADPAFSTVNLSFFNGIASNVAVTWPTSSSSYSLSAVVNLLTATSNNFVVGSSPTQNVGLAANDIAYDPGTNLLYASTDSGTIIPIDPSTGGMGTPITVSGGSVGRVEISATGSILHAAVENKTKLVRVNLATRTVGTPFALGTSVEAVSFAILPGTTDSVVVIITPQFFPSTSTAALFVNGVVKPNVVAVSYPEVIPRITVGGTPNRAYAEWRNNQGGNSVRVLATDNDGVTLQKSYPAAVQYTSDSFIGQGPSLISGSGNVWEAETGNPTGHATLHAPYNYRSAIFDAEAGRVIFLSSSSDHSSNYELLFLESTTFSETGRMAVPATPASDRLVRMNGHNLAYRSSSQVVLVRAPLLPAADAPEPDLAVAQVAGPTRAVAGQPLSFSVLVRNNGNAAANNVVLTDRWNLGAGFQDATTTRGTITHTGDKATFNIGTMAAGEVVTVSITLTGGATSGMNSVRVISSTSESYTVNNASDLTVSLSTNGTAAHPMLEVGPVDLISHAGESSMFASLGYRSGFFAGTVALIDPAKYAVTSFLPVGSDPGPLALAGDGSMLTVGLNGSNKVVSVDAGALTVGAAYSIGDGANGLRLAAREMTAVPGQPARVVVARKDSTGAGAGVALYEGSAQIGAASAAGEGDMSVTFGADATELFAYRTDSSSDTFLFRVGVSAVGGLNVLTSKQVSPMGSRIRYGNGLLIGSGGTAVNSASFAAAGRVGTGYYPYTLAVCPESSRQRIYSIESDNYLRSYNDGTFASLGATYGSAHRSNSPLVRWGSRGLAFIGIGSAGDSVCISNGSALVPEPSAQIVLPATVAENAGTLSAAGTLLLDEAPATDLTVSLQSTNPGLLQVPASVTVLAGQTSATFNVSLIDDALLSGARTVSIISSGPSGYAYLAATTVVTDNESAIVSLTLPATLAEGAGSVTGQAAVNLSSPADAPVTVQLSSSDTTVLAVPASVFIAAGQTSAAIPLNVLDDGYIRGTQTVAVTANVAGWTPASQSIDITDLQTATIAVAYSPSSSPESNTYQSGSVLLGGKVLQPLTVTLTSSHPGRMAVPATVTIPAGSAANYFTATLVNNSSPDGRQIVTTMASASGFTDGTTAFTVVDDDAGTFVWNTPSTVTAGDVMSVVATPRTIDGDPVPLPYGTSLAISASRGGVGVPMTATPLTNDYPNYTPAAGTATITSAGASTVISFTYLGTKYDSPPFTVLAAAHAAFAWNDIPGGGPQPSVPYPVTIGASDAYGNPVAGFTGTAALSAVQSVAAKTVGDGTLTYVPLISTTYELSRHQIVYLASEIGQAGLLRSLAVQVVDPPGRAFDTFTIRAKHTTRTTPDISSGWDNTGWTTLKQGPLNLGQSTGWFEIHLDNSFDYDGSSNLLLDISFQNSAAAPGGSCHGTSTAAGMTSGGTASTGSGYGDPLTWTSGYDSPSFSTYYSRPNLRFGFGTPLTVSPATTGNFVNGVWTGDVTFNSAAGNVVLMAATGNIAGDSNVFDVGAVPPGAPSLTALPAYTAALSDLITWNAVNGATGYYVEMAADNAFSTPLANSGWITGTSYTFTNLTSGTHYYFRAKARNNSFDGPWSNVVDTTQDATGPVIYLGSTDDGVKTAFFTNGSSWNVAGQVLDTGTGIASLQIIFQSVTYPWSFAPNGAWSVNFTNLTPGTYPISFRATDNLGNVTQRNVTITQTTATLSNVATLSNLVPGTGSLSPAFDSSTLAYSMAVSATTGFITLTPTVTQAAATVWINGMPVLSGGTSAALPLVAGNNTIDVVVTAENGVAATTYTLVVTRPSPVPPLTTLAATNVTKTGATLNGSIAANEVDTAVSFDYGLTTSYGNTITGSPAQVTGSGPVAISAVLTGLTPGTTYHYRISDANSYGAGHGADMTFATVGIPKLAVEQPAGAGLTNGTSSVAIGNVLQGASLVVEFTLKNTGSAILTGLEVTFAGTNSAEFTAGALSSTTLARDASMIVNVTFKPGAAGARSAAMHIASDDPDASPFIIGLTGMGLTPGGSKLSIGGAIFTVNEEAGTVNIPVTRTGGNDSAVSVMLSTGNGTATAGNDYTAVTNQVVTFSIGDSTTKNVPVTILHPANTSELNESFSVTLGSPTGGATLGTRKTATVVILDSVDTTQPGTPTITAPLANAKLGVNPSGTVSVTGSATDNQCVGSVEASLDNGISFTPAAVTLTGTGASYGKTATYTVNLTPALGGANTVQVRTRDIRGNVSTMASRGFVVLRPLAVNIAGSGSVTVGFSPTSFREIGKSCTITATPLAAAPPGFAFNGWTVNNTTGTGITPLMQELPTLTFVFREGLVLTANFIPNPFSVAVTGSFNGLILPSNSLPAPGGSLPSNETVGKLTAKVMSTGAFSGTLFIDGMSLGFAGVFDNTGTARFGTNRATTFTVVRTTKPSYDLTLNIDLAPGGTHKITGTLTEHYRSAIKSVSTLAADRAFYNGTTVKVLSNLAGTSTKAYTVCFPAKGLGSQPAGFTLADYPQGDGYATATVNINGTVSVVGKLADGTAISASAPLSKNNTWPLFQRLYPVAGVNKGCIAGQITLDDTQTETDMAGTDLFWFRPFQLVQWYPYGWDEGIKVDLMGAKYVVPPPAPATSVFPGPGPASALKAVHAANGNVEATFSDGLLSGSVTRNVNISPTNVASKPSTNTDAAFTLSITSASGLISGAFTHTDGTKPAYQGVIIQKGTQRGAYGYFMTKQPAVVDYKGESGGAMALAR